MEKEKLMQQEIEEKRKLTKDIKNKIDNDVFYNFWLAVFIMIYMFFINLAYIKLSIYDFKLCIKIFSLILTTITIAYFEISYRRENLKYALTGIELFILNILVMYIPYVYYTQNEIIRKLIMLVPIYYGVYYSVKNLIIYKKEQIKHESNLSDVKEIVKEEKESYLEEDSKKILKEKKRIDEKNKKVKKKIK
ncbi:MAG: hypothetical protein ACI4UE_04610 [Candidatus Scatovivens sp.]